jgi:hypothetical protein
MNLNLWTAKRSDTCKDNIHEISNTSCLTRSYRFVIAMTDWGRLTQIGKLHRTKRRPQMNLFGINSHLFKYIKSQYLSYLACNILSKVICGPHVEKSRDPLQYSPYREKSVWKVSNSEWPKQGDAFSPLLFNFALKYSIRRIEETQEVLKLYGTH